MEIEKNLTLAAPPEAVWALLLDPQAMAACVPGMQSVEVLSDTEYLACMQQKIAFITARFHLRTRIVEQRAPHFLRVEGTGEDASVASSLRQRSEMTLTARADGGTDLHLNVQVDLLGRLGTFGLGVMKTKADRLWDEFGLNLARRLAQEPATDARPDEAHPVSGTPPPQGPAISEAATHTNHPVHPQRPPASPGVRPSAPASWWRRWLGISPSPFDDRDAIRIDIQRGTTHVRIQWPAHSAAECAAWLQAYLK